MRFALVFNPFKYKVHEENLRISQKYFGIFPPLSMAWVAAIAEEAGHQVTIIDARTLRLSKQDVLDRLKEFKPDIMGFMMTTYMYPETLEWIKFLKKYLKIFVVVGGYNLRVYPQESISHPEIDFGIVEHAYYTIPALLRELERGDRNLDDVPGLVYKKDDKIIVTPHPQKIDFDRFPNPARHLLPNHLYAEFPTQRKNFTLMVTSLGCPFKCAFCEASGTAYSPRTSNTVIAEIEECCNKYGIREIDIFDYEFTAMRKRVEQICDGLIERKLDVKWACRSRIDTVDEALLAKMRQAGCGRIYFGIESGSQEILDNVNKGITLKQIRDAVYLTKSKGIQTLGFFLIGAPGDTRKTVKQTLKFAKELDLDYLKFSKCLAKPRTPLWKNMIDNSGKDYWRDWILGKETDHHLIRPWTTLSNDEIDYLTKWAYVKFHARPFKLIKSILQVRSLAEFKRKSFAFLDMVLFQENVAQADINFEAYNENASWFKNFKNLFLKKWSFGNGRS
ncbi:MAG: B12-binding domain-containing radical SAM protein [Candidatus Omnitrophica bacterium]|nr:B12-binding domain-containing radical SAM protein [Candidatus Omnitrophota bacterium]